MSEIELRREIDILRRRNELLERAVARLEQALAPRAESEADEITVATSATSVMLRAAPDDLRGSQRFLRAIFDEALDPMVLTNAAGECVDANPAACELFGLSFDELLSRRIGDMITAVSVADGNAQAFRQRGHMRAEYTLVRAGEVRRLELSAVSNVAPGVDLSVMRDITDRTATEGALRRNEALFRALIEKSAEVISLTDADGATRYLTPSAWRLLGWTEKDLGTRTLRDQVIPQDQRRIQSELDHLVRSGTRDLSLEFRVRHRDGSIRWIESTGTNLLADPNVRAIVGNYRDITRRKQAEWELRESRDRLEDAQAIAHVGSWISGFWPDGEIQWSRESCAILGIPNGTSMTVQRLFDHIHPDDRERIRQAWRVATDGRPTDVEHRIQRPDGQVRYVRQRGIVERDANGNPTRFVGTMQDITDRRDAIDALSKSEERYRRIVENTSEGVWTYDPQGATTFMNTRMAEMLGCSVDEAMRQPVLSFVAHSWQDAARLRTERRRRGIAERSDFKLRRRDGTELWTSIQANPLFDAQGRFEGGLALVSDISERRRADEIRARLAAIVESSDNAIVSLDLSGAITSWNLGAERLYQHASADVLGKSVLLLIPTDDWEAERQVLERIAAGERVPQYETTRARRDGSIVEVAVTVSPICDPSGNVIGCSKTSRDLTAQRSSEAALHRTEEQFRQAQKMEAIGRLAGGVAHDFNNLLTVILSYAQLAIDELVGDTSVRDYVTEIYAAGTSASQLTKQLLAFSRQQVLQPRVIDINQIIEEIESMLRRLVGEDIELTALLSPDLGSVLADSGQIEQVLMNLAVNSRDAMRDGGQLTIKTANVRLGPEYVGSALDFTPGEYVMLAVSDTGTGMDAATRARVFEPFFTTKEVGRGTGLGLSTVFGIVQQSGGHITVHSEPGCGCTFKVFLPRTDELAERVRVADAPTDMPGSETILLVEDEEQVRGVAASVLRRQGYTVLECANGDEALLVSKNFGADIHLLLTDVVMPRMSGQKLATALTAQRPDIRVLFTSGYTDDTTVHHGVLAGDVAFLQKPYAPDSLLRTVREAFAETARR